MMSTLAALALTFTALISLQSPPPPTPATVVFVCEHGAAKSLIATLYFNKLAAERGLAARAAFRGVDPQDALSVPEMHSKDLRSSCESEQCFYT